MQFSRPKSLRGFSLFELLMFLSILGILTALAVPGLAGQQEAFKSARDRRNAQEIVTVCTAAKAAGLDFVAAGDLDTTIRNVIQGGTPSHGVLKGKMFRITSLDDASAAAAARFLAIEHGQLIYRNRDV